MRLLVTGGCGFIGSAFVRLALARGAEVVNLDKLTYAGNPANVAEVAGERGYSFVHADIADAVAVRRAIEGADAVVNLAAESHVDRSILEPADFIRTDVVGTAVLLDAARQAGVGRFVQVSTDEVYGSIASGAFAETDPISPSSPYSASKAGGDLQVLAWHRTFGLDTVITRGSNTFGPRQYPEKLIPLFVTNALDGLKLPVYGDGSQVRDWIHGRDHANGILYALLGGTPGEVYNIGGGRENSCSIIEAFARAEALTRKAMSWQYVPKAREGDHICYISDLGKMKRHYPGWRITRSLDDIFGELVEAWMQRA